MILVNGVAGGGLDPSDRAVAYGDGVFRTFPLLAAVVPHWPRQYGKLASDSVRLGIACPPREVLEDDIRQLVAVNADGVVRITLTRGTGPRGYAVPGIQRTTRIVSWSPLRTTRQSPHGVCIRWCNLRLSAQPALAGIKHLNRLENVLARSEWDDPGIAEGLMLNAAGHVISGTMTNLLILQSDELSTPALDQCGVAGVTRDLLIERASLAGVKVAVTAITQDTLLNASAVFLVNSVIGLWQVARLGDKVWSPHPFADQMRAWISDAQD